eukprot:2884970-Prymnesium_polylepis.1
MGRMSLDLLDEEWEGDCHEYLVGFQSSPMLGFEVLLGMALGSHDAPEVSRGAVCSNLSLTGAHQASSMSDAILLRVKVHARARGCSKGRMTSQPLRHNQVMGCFESMDEQMKHSFKLMGSFMILYMTLVVVLLLNVRPAIRSQILPC